MKKSIMISILKSGKTEIFPLKIKNKAKISTLATSIQHSMEVLARATNGIQIGKVEIKSSLFVYDMVLFVAKSKKSMNKKLLEFL